LTVLNDKSSAPNPISILRALGNLTPAKKATGFIFGKLLNKKELQRSPFRPKPTQLNVFDHVCGTAICRNALVANEKQIATTHCDE
jgi:hypothetical protein